MEFLMSCEISILGFSNFPETLQSSCSSSVVGHRTRRMFQKTLRNFFERRPSMCHLENVSLKLFGNDQFVRMANQFSTQLTSIHIHIADRSQLREFKSLSHLENLIDVSLQINSSCPIVNCSHGLHITHVYNSDDDSSNDVAQLSNGIEHDNKSLWPKTLRFVSFPKLRRFQIILSSNWYIHNSVFSHLFFVL
ncbi:unnamed protein product [Anisakis simplex]|uniref:F-box/LRR-repeat protein n=1 Tax=Anisakis simplex TaxID=6269 RepID=A0A0M3JAQ9_ANISI|nr:unnamed protein product [Anisakis simplex]